MVGGNDDVNSEIVLNPKQWNARLSTNIWAYSTTILFIVSGFFTVYSEYNQNFEDTWYGLITVVTCGGVLLAWALACYAEAFAINSLRKKRLNHGIQSNGDKFLIAFWFISSLLLLTPVILIALSIVG